MSPSKSFLVKSREHWLQEEKKAKVRVDHAHEMHLLREKQLKEIADAEAAAKPKVAFPVKHLISDAWGYHPGVHDGEDLICPASEPLLAICKCTVVRVSPSGWWGKGAPADPVLLARGDGVIVLRSLVSVGPIKTGMNFVYGHAEHAVVKVGQVVEAGEKIGLAGFANAWHCHFCVNTRSDALGVGTQDPRPILDFAKKP